MIAALMMQVALGTAAPSLAPAGTINPAAQLNLPPGIKDPLNRSRETVSANGLVTLATGPNQSFSPEDKYAVAKLPPVQHRAGDRVNAHTDAQRTTTLLKDGTRLATRLNPASRQRLGGGTDSPSPEAQTYDPRDRFETDPREIFESRQRALENPTSPN